MRPLESEIKVSQTSGMDWAGPMLVFSSKHGHANVSIGAPEVVASLFADLDAWADQVAADYVLENLPDGSNVAYLGSIEVNVQTRGGGEGARLLRHVLKWVDDNGVAATFLYALPTGRGLDLKGLTAWYKRHGFDHITRQPTSVDLCYNACEDTSRVMVRHRPARRAGKRH